MSDNNQHLRKKLLNIVLYSRKMQAKVSQGGRERCPTNLHCCCCCCRGWPFAAGSLGSSWFSESFWMWPGTLFPWFRNLRHLLHCYCCSWCRSNFLCCNKPWSFLCGNKPWRFCFFLCVNLFCIITPWWFCFFLCLDFFCIITTLLQYSISHRSSEWRHLSCDNVLFNWCCSCFIENRRHCCRHRSLGGSPPPFRNNNFLLASICNLSGLLSEDRQCGTSGRSPHCRRIRFHNPLLDFWCLSLLGDDRSLPCRSKSTFDNILLMGLCCCSHLSLFQWNRKSDSSGRSSSYCRCNSFNNLLLDSYYCSYLSLVIKDTRCSIASEGISHFRRSKDNLLFLGINCLLHMSKSLGNRGWSFSCSFQVTTIFFTIGLLLRCNYEVCNCCNNRSTRCDAAIRLGGGQFEETWRCQTRKSTGTHWPFIFASVFLTQSPMPLHFDSELQIPSKWRHQLLLLLLQLSNSPPTCSIPILLWQRQAIYKTHAVSITIISLLLRVLPGLLGNRKHMTRCEILPQYSLTQWLVAPLDDGVQTVLLLWLVQVGAQLRTERWYAPHGHRCCCCWCCHYAAAPATKQTQPKELEGLETPKKTLILLLRHLNQPAKNNPPAELMNLQLRTSPASKPSPTRRSFLSVSGVLVGALFLGAGGKRTKARLNCRSWRMKEWGASHWRSTSWIRCQLLQYLAPVQH